MTFLSLLVALLIEQCRPLRADNVIYTSLHHFSLKIETWFNAGEPRHGCWAWVSMMLLSVVPILLLYWWARHSLGAFAVFLLNVAVVYLTLGFRRYSHHFNAVQQALSVDDLPSARTALSAWTTQETAHMTASALSKVVVEGTLITTHRHVFGVFFWFLMPLGPAGAVMYRMADDLRLSWGEQARSMRDKEDKQDKQDMFGQFAERAFYWIDWIPARLTVMSFAIVGNFEDAVAAWRSFVAQGKNDNEGLVLSGGCGAMTWDHRILQSTVGLVWRALVLWMFVLLVLSIIVWIA